MENQVFEAGEGPQRRQPREEHKVRGDVTTFLRGWNGCHWSEERPRSDKDVAALFDKLTLDDISPADRMNMTCTNLLETVAGRVDSNSRTQIMILAGACALAIKKNMLAVSDSNRIMRLRLETENDQALSQWRTGASKCLQFQDMLSNVKSVDPTVKSVAPFAYICLEFRSW